MGARLTLTRRQILDFRRHTGHLDARRPAGAAAFRRAAWAGLQDSMPRAALLSLHARVTGVTPTALTHPSLVQLWGPRYQVYVVAARDLPLFSLGRMPTDARGRTRATEAARRLRSGLRGRRMPFGHVGRELGVPANSLRYAAPTGTALLHWDGAKQPDVWVVPAPTMAPDVARSELARRFLHTFGPSTAAAFARWAGVRASDASETFTALTRELIPVATPIGEAVLLATDERTCLQSGSMPGQARLLPSGDAYYLAWEADRVLLVPERNHRAALWTSRVWPGALLVNGEIAGTWRRAGGEVTLMPWRRLSGHERRAVDAEASALPIPDVSSLAVRWSRTSP